jgi:hypothetical protein
MPETPHLSLITPVVNGEAYILATVRAVVDVLGGCLRDGPKCGAGQGRSREQRKRASHVQSARARIVVVVAVPAALLPHFVLATMFGGRYASASNGVLPMLIAGAGFAMINLLVVYTVAIGYPRSTYLLLAMVPVQVGAIAAFHQSVTQVATVQAVVVVLALSLNELFFHPLLRSDPLVREIGSRSRPSD